jgi:hypothetical protein
MLPPQGPPQASVRGADRAKTPAAALTAKTLKSLFMIWCSCGKCRDESGLLSLDRQLVSSTQEKMILLNYEIVNRGVDAEGDPLSAQLIDYKI